MNMETPSVDINRLKDLTDGNREEMREFIELYFQQTTAQLAGLKVAIQERSAGQIRHLAHTCAGASATCGINGMAVLLREIETAGRNNLLSGTPRLLEQAES